MAAAQETSPADPAHRRRWVWFVAGPTACGKTTIAKHLAQELGFTFVEGDDYHPEANRAKMSRGEALTDEDRHDWLLALRDLETAPPPPAPEEGAHAPTAPRHLVVTCSALKRQYRDVLRGGAQQQQQQHATTGDRARARARVRVGFVFLDVPEDVLFERARQRKGHFAGEGLVKSQVESLERPGREEEEEDVVIVRVERGREVADTQREVLERVREVMRRE
ncbi:hypothetical protein VTK56DRAFT_8100 [Thermocarpiscus australiensis]